MATYYATKAFVLSLSESLAAEFAGTGVSVTALCPGPVLTGFQEAAGIPVRPHPRRAWLRNLLSTEAEEVARAGYAGMIAGKPVVVPGLANKMIVQVTRILPRRTVMALMRRAQGQR
jgi:short-subunit dehydrogenase